MALSKGKKRILVTLSIEELEILKELSSEDSSTASAYLRTLFISSPAYVMKKREIDNRLMENIQNQ